MNKEWWSKRGEKIQGVQKSGKSSSVESVWEWEHLFSIHPDDSLRYCRDIPCLPPGRELMRNLIDDSLRFHATLKKVSRLLRTNTT